MSAEMSQHLDVAWLETSSGDRWSIQASCSLGRSPTNQVVLPDAKVSRRHAIIHCQGEKEFWLVDLGSGNGTYLNGRRLAHPNRLKDQDQVTIGEFQLVFRQPRSGRATANETVIDKTIADIKSVPCWLLVADIVGSTELGKSLSPEELPVVTGQWLDRCQQIIDENHGAINKFLGDGFFAYWQERESTLAAVVNTLAGLKKLQANEALHFRIAVHYGQVSIGGAASMGEESLLGSEVNFVFRMEKLAGSLLLPSLISSAAQQRIETRLPVSEAGRHSLPGLGGPHLFYKF